MTVHELIEVLFAAGDWGRVGDIPRLEAEIREAVIEEASVGTFDIKADGYPLLDNPFPLTLREKPADGWTEYNLIPRPTPH